MQQRYIIGIDQSTQGTKAILTDREGEIVGKSFLPHEQIISPDGWVSHDGEEIYRNVIAVVRQLVESAAINKKDVAAIGISNQRETTIAWDRGGKVDYVLEGNINYSGAVITWLQKDLGLIESAKETAALAKEANGEDTTYLIPAFSGLGAPYWKDEARAAFVGMSRTTGRKELVKADYRVYTVMGDGELAEGSVWEGAMAAGHFRLDNLCAVVDRNGLQISGSTEDVMNHEPLAARFAAFGWHIIECSGNDMDALDAAFTEAKATKGKPSVVIAHTVKGCGSAVMENKAPWHHKVPSAEEYARIEADLSVKEEAIRNA